MIDELEDMKRIHFRGININNNKYAYDILLIADSEEKLMRLVDNLNHRGYGRYGLEINIGKTDVINITMRSK